MPARLQDVHERACRKEPHYLELELCWETLEVKQGHNGDYSSCVLCWFGKTIHLLFVFAKHGKRSVKIERRSCGRRANREPRPDGFYLRQTEGGTARRYGTPLWPASASPSPRSGYPALNHRLLRTSLLPPCLHEDARSFLARLRARTSTKKKGLRRSAQKVTRPWGATSLRIGEESRQLEHGRPLKREAVSMDGELS